MISEKELKQMEARFKAAAPGPYRRGIGSTSHTIYDKHGSMITTDCASATGTFFAAAWQDMRLLIREVRRLQCE